MAVIGPAAEKLSLISGVVTVGGRIAARSGLGAVMGSKKLKAVAFNGSRTIPVAHPDKIKALNAGYMAEFKKDPRLMDKLSIRFMDVVSKLLPNEWPSTCALTFKGLFPPSQANAFQNPYIKKFLESC